MPDTSTSEVPVSVIISTRNRSHWIGDCLESLIAQDCPCDFEIVVIDNGSTDETPRVLDGWRRRHPMIRIYPEPRPGLSAGKNAGARQARGDLLLFTDDDVIVDPGWIRAYLDLFEKLPEGDIIAGGPIVPISSSLAPWPEWFDEAALPEAGMLHYDSQRQLTNWEYVWGANMAIPADLFRKVGPWNESLGRRESERGTFEDTEYQDRLVAKGGKLWFCPKATLRHRVGPERVRPNKIMETAFNRGRNSLLRESLASYGSLEKAPRRNIVTGVGRSICGFAAWLLWAQIFRVARTRHAFRRTREHAFRSGRHTEMMRAGRPSSQMAHVLAKSALLARTLTLNLTPG